jgi:2-polyprenyl-6-methoxyphenol hydroxylase-like FAD-dependent oxidoreductase
MPEPTELHPDVLIIGGGLAGLTLARQLLLRSELEVLLVDRRPLPPERQKVGEATVQVSGYYYARVLQMEEHLLCSHYLKYNLRFYWPGGEAGGDAGSYESLSQSFIRPLSNIATYQLDRNVFEAAVLAVNSASPRFTLQAPATDLAVELARGSGDEPAAPHRFRFRTAAGDWQGSARWVVDASGRARVLARREQLVTPSPIRHGSTFCWVDGLVDIERLTALTPDQVRKRRDRAVLGHVPVFLATNHFCGEGFWFWVIPLHGKTSLGLVYDRERVPRAEVATPEKMIAWVCERFPMFARDLPQRRIVDQSGFTDFALDATRTLSTDRWAMCGEACRFSDPLYSPGGDLISIYNTLITDAILAPTHAELKARVPLYEALARAAYEAYVPSFAVSYDTLGDQEVFTLRYVWELTIYFAFYVFPFINDLFTDREFGAFYLREFSRLGPLNRGLHEFLVGYYRWKKDCLEPPPSGQPRFIDFMEFGALRAAESCFYKVGLSAAEAKPVLTEQRGNVEELARFIIAHVVEVVSGDARAMSAAFVEGIDLRRPVFDPQAFARSLDALGEGTERPHAWRLPTPSLARFQQAPRAVPRPAMGSTPAEPSEAAS